MSQVDLQRVPHFYHKYIQQVNAANLEEAFALHQQVLPELLQNLPQEKWDYKYADGKWSVKEMVQHIIDAERIFCYRALAFARKDSNALPGFDEDSYAVTSKAERRAATGLIEELRTVQKSSALLFSSFDDEQLERSGVANGNPTYVKGIGFILVGHALHHMNILKERYL
jgi:uncharacterized damage-inducible protein DinB